MRGLVWLRVVCKYLRVIQRDVFAPIAIIIKSGILGNSLPLLLHHRWDIVNTKNSQSLAAKNYHPDDDGRVEKLSPLATSRTT